MPKIKVKRFRGELGVLVCGGVKMKLNYSEAKSLYQFLGTVDEEKLALSGISNPKTVAYILRDIWREMNERGVEVGENWS